MKAVILLASGVAGLLLKPVHKPYYNKCEFYVSYNQEKSHKYTALGYGESLKICGDTEVTCGKKTIEDPSMGPPPVPEWNIDPDNIVANSSHHKKRKVKTHKRVANVLEVSKDGLTMRRFVAGKLGKFSARHTYLSADQHCAVSGLEETAFVSLNTRPSIPWATKDPSKANIFDHCEIEVTDVLGTTEMTVLFGEIPAEICGASGIKVGCERAGMLDDKLMTIYKDGGPVEQWWSGTRKDHPASHDQFTQIWGAAGCIVKGREHASDVEHPDLAEIGLMCSGSIQLDSESVSFAMANGTTVYPTNQDDHKAQLSCSKSPHGPFRLFVNGELKHKSLSGDFGHIELVSA